MALEAAPLEAGKGQCLGKSRSVHWRGQRSCPPVSVYLSVYTLWEEFLLETEPTDRAAEFHLLGRGISGML